MKLSDLLQRNSNYCLYPLYIESNIKTKTTKREENKRKTKNGKERKERERKRSQN
jgi:hypothetical protein